jgi:hypothetical protein
METDFCSASQHNAFPRARTKVKVNVQHVHKDGMCFLSRLTNGHGQIETCYRLDTREKE